MDNIVRKIKPSEMSYFRISVDDFIKQYNDGECELIDIRLPFEVARWQLNFGMIIPTSELPERLDELPKDKLLVIACPQSERANMVSFYLKTQGFNAKYLMGGMIDLIDRLKGGKAKDLKVQA